MGQAETKVIRTESGILELVPATIDQLRGIARYWPMELLGYGDGPPDFGLVFQHGDEEVYGVKMQCLEMPEADAMALHHRFRNMIAGALPRYLQKNHQGVMVPCAYFKEKSPGMFETGLAFFVGPAPEDAAMAGPGDKTHWDEKLGAGAKRMILDVVDSLGDPNPASGREAPAATNVLHVIGMDLRPRLAMGSIVMPFVVQGQSILVVKHPMTEDEPLWNKVVRAGFSKLPYASIVPAGFAGEPPADLEHR
jgi:hypothetical protein